MYWKGKIEGGKTLDAPIMTIDILPTLAHVTGAKLPESKIDGINVWPVLEDPENKKLPDRALFFYYQVNQLQSMRWKDWKLYFPHTYRTMQDQPPGKDGIPGPYRYVKVVEHELYNLRTDPFEEKNIAEQFPEVVTRMVAMADTMRIETGDALTQIKGKNTREPGKVE